MTAYNIHVAGKLTLVEKWDVQAKVLKEILCYWSLRPSAQRLQRTCGTNLTAGVRPDVGSIPWWRLGATCTVRSIMALQFEEHFPAKRMRELVGLDTMPLTLKFAQTKPISLRP